MELDNELLGVWLKAETLTKEEIRFLIETIQTMRNQLEEAEDSSGYETSFDRRDSCNLQEIATAPPRRFRFTDYFLT